MEQNRRPRVILVSGAVQARPEEIERAEQVGRLLAQAGAVVLTGGGSGVMEAACRGARLAGGITLGVLPGADASESPPNEHVRLAVYTGMRDARNAILVRTADAVIAIGGGWGTLSEIALARKAGRPTILLGSWELAAPDPALRGIPSQARDAAEAVAQALAAVGP